MLRDRSSLLSRREILGMAAGISGIIGTAAAQDAARVFTPQMTAGPFYPQIKPLDQDSDLTRIRGHKAGAAGSIIHVAGTVTNLQGRPVRNAKMEIWQADSNGRYSHKSDPNKAPLDPDFQGYCVLKTDNEGRYRFKTIMPAPYPGTTAGMRTPHIHFDVFGRYDRLTTQMFFPGEPLNATDRIFHEIRRDSGREAVTAKLAPPEGDMKANEKVFLWNIVLASG